jgi:hypothetical protein
MDKQNNFIGINDIYKLLTSVYNDIQYIKDKNLSDIIEEVSLSKASKLLRCGKERILEYIKEGLLPARTIKRGSGVGYKIRISAIRKMQEQLEFETTCKFEVESVEEIFERIKKNNPTG